MQFVFTANSPGEVATWLTPVVRAVRQEAPKAHIAVYLVPCAFATGAETDVVAALPEVDAAYGPQQYWRVALGLQTPRRRRPGALLFLGGDLVHAVWLARRLGLPPYAYVERSSPWTKRFRRVFVPDEDAKERVARGQRSEAAASVHVVGNLMVDAVQRARSETGMSPPFRSPPFRLAAHRPTVALFPGSRPYEVELMLPFMLRALELVAAKRPDVQYVVSLSPFTADTDRQRAAGGPLAGTHFSIAETEAGLSLTTAGGLQATVVRGRPYDVMQVADVALTVPGSNTAEMAAAGLPMVVALPLNVAERIPLPGAAQYIEKFPVWGKRWKRQLVMQRADRMPFVAWPNRKAGRMVVPEVRGQLAPDDVVPDILRLLSEPDTRSATAKTLRHVMGPKGAARRIARQLVADVAARMAARNTGGGP